MGEISGRYYKKERLLPAKTKFRNMLSQEGYTILQCDGGFSERRVSIGE
jgi:hypothetical protein